MRIIYTHVYTYRSYAACAHLGIETVNNSGESYNPLCATFEIIQVIVYEFNIWNTQLNLSLERAKQIIDTITKSITVV